MAIRSVIGDLIQDWRVVKAADAHAVAMKFDRVAVAVAHRRSFDITLKALCVLYGTPEPCFKHVGLSPVVAHALRFSAIAWLVMAVRSLDTFLEVC